MAHDIPEMFYERLMVHEGFYDTVYPCPTGHPTVGYGTNLDTWHDKKACARWLEKGITREEADKVMREEAELQCSRLAGVCPEYDALCVQGEHVRALVLVNMAYNMGAGGVAGFGRMRAALREGRWQDAARELLDSKYARQVKRRARELAAQLEHGRWCAEVYER